MHVLSSAPADGSWVHIAGNAVYPEERERILGQKAKRTRRLAERAARRSKVTGLACLRPQAAVHSSLWLLHGPLSISSRLKPACGP